MRLGDYDADRQTGPAPGKALSCETPGCCQVTRLLCATTSAISPYQSIGSATNPTHASARRPYLVCLPRQPLKITTGQAVRVVATRSRLMPESRPRCTVLGCPPPDNLGPCLNMRRLAGPPITPEAAAPPAAPSRRHVQMIAVSEGMHKLGDAANGGAWRGLGRAIDASVTSCGWCRSPIWLVVGVIVVDCSERLYSDKVRSSVRVALVLGFAV